jgi:hypothetical protein
MRTEVVHCLPLVTPCDPLAASGCLPPTECAYPPGTACVVFMSRACMDTPITCDVLVSLPLCHDVLKTDVPQATTPRRSRFNANSLAGLGVMRRQLAANLRVVRRREQALASALAPRTKEQIELAEKILKDALRDLEQHKKFVQEKAPRRPPGRGGRNRPGGK